MQTYPALKVLASKRISIVFIRSQLSVIIKGSDPPNSKIQFLKLAYDYEAINFPTKTLPVKQTPFT